MTLSKYMFCLMSNLKKYAIKLVLKFVHSFNSKTTSKFMQEICKFSCSDYNIECLLNYILDLWNN